MLHDQMNSSCQRELIYFVYSVTSGMLIMRPITSILHIQKTTCGATITGVQPQHLFFSFFIYHLGAKLLWNEWQLEDVLTSGRNSHQREVNVAQMTPHASRNFEAWSLEGKCKTLFWGWNSLCCKSPQRHELLRIIACSSLCHKSGSCLS